MNQKAYYGEFGGQYVAESLMNTLEELDKAFEEAIHLRRQSMIRNLWSSTITI